jgi:formylglycine-generating enzyme required for sulfatase activity
MGDLFGDGEADVKPVHMVTVSDFYMGKTEVTVAQYRAFCSATNRAMPEPPPWGWNDNHPIVWVSWNDSKAFCDWAKCKLPTEAEWEYAAREEGKWVRFGNGKDIADPSQINFDGGAQWKEPYSVAGVYREKTTPVASFSPNALGLYDMSGNVWEWCSDWYGENYYNGSPTLNPKGPNSGEARVLRGGAWRSTPGLCRASYRFHVNPVSGFNFGGFRVSKTP